MGERGYDVNRKRGLRFMGHGVCFARPRPLIRARRSCHSRALAHQAFPLSACNIERWVWPGDEAKRPVGRYLTSTSPLILEPL